MEISLTRKIFTSLFFILFAFILLYIFSIWSSVFILKGSSERLPYINMDQQGQILQKSEISEQIFSIGIHEGDGEIALYLTIVVILIAIIPLLLGLFMYWRVNEKTAVIRKVIISSFIFQFVGFLLLWFVTFERVLYFFPLPFHRHLQEFSVFLIRFFPLLLVVAILLYVVYWILFVLLDKKFSIRSLVFVLSIISLILSLNFSTEVYVYAGCNNYKDQYCINTLAIKKDDVSICEKTANDFYKNMCISEYASNKYDPSGICLKLSSSVKDKGMGVSLQTQCVMKLNTIINVPPTSFFGRPHFVTLQEKNKNCDVLNNSNERDFCKKMAECLYEPENQHGQGYNECKEQFQTLLEVK